jgi:hypothetical protein
MKKKFENWVKTTQIKGSGTDKEESINLDVNLVKT